MQALDIIAQLPYEFICPAQVKTKIITGFALGYPVALPDWVNVLSLQTPLTPVASLALDDGFAVSWRVNSRQFATLSPQSTTAPLSQRMRITTIEIKNFRAIKGRPLKIDLRKTGKNLLVYGERLGFHAFAIAG
jgi:hypothetical protein